MFGEEHGLVGNTGSPWRWIIDPIDGTSNFVRGIPVWATLIALTHVEHGPVVGVVSAPALARRWWAARGLGAFADGRECHVSTVAQLDEAQVCVTLLLRMGRGRADQRSRRAAAAAHTGPAASATSGSTCWWPRERSTWPSTPIGLAPYDLAAVMVVVEEAGGTFTDRHGERTYLNDSAVSSNGLLHHHIAGLG